MTGIERIQLEIAGLREGLEIEREENARLQAELASYKGACEQFVEYQHELCKLLGCDADTDSIALHDRIKSGIERLREALSNLLPGLILDLRYADDDDDKVALRSRVKTVEEALS